MLNHTTLPTDIINIIYDYSNETIKLCIRAKNENSRYYTNVCFDNVDLIFSFICIGDIIEKYIFVNNIMTNIFNYCSYNNENDIERRQYIAKNNLLDDIGYELMHDHIPKYVKFDGNGNVEDNIFEYQPYKNRYNKMLKEVGYDSGVEDNINNKLYPQIDDYSSKTNWIFDENVYESFDDYSFLHSDDLSHVNIIYFFNCYMKHYYRKNNYFNIKEDKNENCKYRHNKVFVYKICLEHILDTYYTLFYPVDHKK